MTRMSLLHTRREFVLTTAALALPGRLFARQQTPPPAGTFEALRRNVGFFTARGGTIGWLINKDAVVAVDTQYANTAPRCVEGLKERSAGRAIDITFNTHHHPDHTGGNAVFQAVSKRMVAHRRVPELMKQFASTQPAAPAPVLPTVTFDDTWSETAGDETVTARHYGPGHTGGDGVIVFEKAEVVHMGDLLFCELHPRVDRPGGANIQNWMRTLETVSNTLPSDARYIAGHARPGHPVVVKRDALLALRNYFDAALTYVRRGIAEKKSQAEITGIAALPGFEQYQSSGQILTLSGTLAAAYDELSAQ